METTAPALEIPMIKNNDNTYSFMENIKLTPETVRYITIAFENDNKHRECVRKAYKPKKEQKANRPNLYIKIVND